MIVGADGVGDFAAGFAFRPEAEQAVEDDFRFWIGDCGLRNDLAKFGEIFCGQRAEGVFGKGQAQINFPTPFLQVPGGDERVAGVVALATEDDAESGMTVELADNFRDAESGAFHQIRRLDPSRECGLLGLPHPVTTDNHERI